MAITLGTGSGLAGDGNKPGSGHSNDQEAKLTTVATPITAAPVSNTTGTTVQTSFNKFMSGPLQVQRGPGGRRPRDRRVATLGQVENAVHGATAVALRRPALNG
jgi:hypothetical protein